MNESVLTGREKAPPKEEKIFLTPAAQIQVVTEAANEVVARWKQIAEDIPVEQITQGISLSPEDQTKKPVKVKAVHQISQRFSRFAVPAAVFTVPEDTPVVPFGRRKAVAAAEPHPHAVTRKRKQEVSAILGIPLLPEDRARPKDAKRARNFGANINIPL
eukprot:TRINITY_DN56596_c0_g1_i1.p1 TRINITY_DN56596_c0_g1~~TRINITY_DN56596_c0_g1_i1.p1  ORF type:complete len:168 (+),score=23.22 TRINITY_DN56596_c0_g1_i1:25-504(+)